MNVNDYFSSTLNLFNKTGFSSPASLQVQFKQQELYSPRQLLGITARNWVLLSEKAGWLGRELESQLQLIQEETLLFYMHSLGDQGQEKRPSPSNEDLRFSLRSAGARSLQAATHSPSLLPSTHTHISIYKIFPVLPLTGHSVIFWVQRLMLELSSMVVHRFCLLSQPQ